jgi:two-component system response regulator HydG
VIVISGHVEAAAAVEALRARAYDFLSKSTDFDDQARVIREAALSYRVHRASFRPLATDGASEGVHLGDSAAMHEVSEIVRRVAPMGTTVLITGETGTGKELLARSVHQASPRVAGPFIAVNCGAIPARLFESEFFGHASGAFTGAVGPRAGLLQEASGGTLFLDEVAELDLGMQAKLLRALQEREVRPVGADRAIPVDVRLIAATNRDLQTLVQQGVFRGDLFYRLNVVPIRVPALRDRGADVIALARRFVARFAEQMGRRVQGLTPDVARQLMSFPWPGNVRQLENVIERAVALARFELLRLEDLPDDVRSCSVRVPTTETPSSELPTL